MPQNGIPHRGHGGYYGVRKYALRTGKQPEIVHRSGQPDKYKKDKQYKQDKQYQSENTERKTKNGVLVGETNERQKAKRSGDGIGQ